MAQLKDTVVQGSLRVTDTTYTTNLNLSSVTAWGVVYANNDKNVINTSAGTSGYLLQGNGAAAPSWIQATNSNTANTIIKRDSSGNFSAGTITATLSGNASTATKWASAQTVYVALGTASTTTSIQGGNSNAVALGIDGTLAVGHGGTGTSSAPTQYGIIYASTTSKYASTGAGTSGYLLQSNATSAPSWIQATNSNTASTIVKRDSSGNFSAGTITAALSGNASTATKWASAQTVYVALGTASTSTTIQGGSNSAVQLGVNGTLGVGNGGTGTSSTPTKGGIIYAASTSQYASTGIGTVGNPLISGSANAPTWHGGVTFTGSSTSDYAANFSGTLTVGGTSTFNGTLIGKNELNYGTALPGSGTLGRIFFQISPNEYELPAGGTQGQALIKASNSDRDVTWGPVGGIMQPDTTTKYYVTGSASNVQNTDPAIFDTAIYVQSHVLYGAAWNDYAEYREANIKEPGRVIIEQGNDTLQISTERLQPGAEIISDTYGFAIGETVNAKTPIATSGRVLAYPYEDREIFRQNIGRPVCSGPNGTVSIMTQEEYEKYGYCAIGTISAVPDYEEWGEKKVKVKGRVWIRVK